jgi:hypothetical protein
MRKLKEKGYDSVRLIDQVAAAMVVAAMVVVARVVAVVVARVGGRRRL